MWSADFSGAYLGRADLSGSVLNRVKFDDADISGTQFSRYGGTPAVGITQMQLDRAIARLGDPPLLDGVVDYQTGLPLRWRSG